jgi:hypothetical protein
MVEGANVARELSQQFGNPSQDHWKELRGFVGYLRVNKDRLKIGFISQNN